MQYVILTFSIILFSPIAIGSANTTTVFSWLDTNGVTHYTDEKPEMISEDTITVTDVAEPSELGTPKIKVPVMDDSNIATDDLQATADEKSPMVSEGAVTITEIADPSELGTPKVNVPAMNDSDITTDEIQATQLLDVDNNAIEKLADTAVVASKTDTSDVELQQ